MAERAAHITPITQLRPSVFEVIAQDSMSTVFHPALYRLTSFLATTNPDRYGWLISWYEEIYLVFNSVLQYHYLRCHGASFSEFFYGLQRMSPKSQIFPRLPNKKEKLSLACLTLLPYLRAKLENLAMKYRLEGNASHWAHFVDGTHRTLNMAWESTMLAKYLSYLMGYTTTHSPLLDLVGVTLQYAAEEKTQEKHCLRLQEIVSLKTLGSLLTFSLEFGAFFLQFLQWWYASEKRPANFGALPPPPAPQVIQAKSQYKGLCPLCLQKRRIDTLLSTSGYTFCYRCIVQHLRENRTCPVTKYPSSEEDLIQLHIESS